jgi:hypothetical protein
MKGDEDEQRALLRPIADNGRIRIRNERWEEGDELTALQQACVLSVIQEQQECHCSMREHGYGTTVNIARGREIYNAWHP